MLLVYMDSNFLKSLLAKVTMGHFHESTICEILLLGKRVGTVVAVSIAVTLCARSRKLQFSNLLL